MNALSQLVGLAESWRSQKYKSGSMRKFSVLRIMTAGLFVMCTASCFRENSKSPIVGAWKGTDEYGHEHFFDFQQDGTLTWWDMDRSLEDGSFTKRGPFRGHWSRNENGAFELTNGFESLGVLIGGENELRQDDSGHALRRRLIYKKVNPN